MKFQRVCYFESFFPHGVLRLQLHLEPPHLLGGLRRHVDRSGGGREREHARLRGRASSLLRLPLALGLLLLEVLPLALRLLRLCRSRALAHGVLAAGSLAGVSSLEGLNDTTAPPPLLPITINHYKYSIKCRVQVPSTNSHRAQRLEDPADPFPSLPISFQPYHRFWLWLPPALLSLWCAGLTSSALGCGPGRVLPSPVWGTRDLERRRVLQFAA